MPIQRGDYRRRTLHHRGFTMVEMVVAIGMFTVFMLLIVGSFLSITDAARKARSTRIALDNVSSAIDYMAREIRLGSYFRCENDATSPVQPTAPYNTPVDCLYGGAGGNVLTFERAGGVLSDPADQLVFWYENGRLWRSTASGVNPEALTAPELNVTQFHFYVSGTAYSILGSPADQPRITLVIQGIAGGNKVRTQAPFSLQTTLSARTPNIPPS